jgi:hypothetical protein
MQMNISEEYIAPDSMNTAAMDVYSLALLWLATICRRAYSMRPAMARVMDAFRIDESEQWRMENSTGDWNQGKEIGWIFWKNARVTKTVDEGVNE